MIAGAQERGAKPFLFTVEVQLLSITADLVEGPATEQMREADVRRDAASVRDRCRLHRRRPGPAIGFRLRAADRRNLRVRVHQGDRFFQSASTEQIRIVVHQ